MSDASTTPAPDPDRTGTRPRRTDPDPASRGTPARVGGAVATAVVTLAGLGAGVALGMPVAAVVVLLGSLILAAGGRLLDTGAGGDSDTATATGVGGGLTGRPARLAAGSTLLVGGAVATAAAPWLIYRPSATQVVALLASGIAAFAAASDTLGGFVDVDDFGLSPGAIGTLYGTVVVAGGALVAGLTHAYGLDWLTLPVEALAYAAGVTGGYHLAAFVGLAVVEAAAFAWLGNAVLAAAPLSTLTRPPVGLDESTVDRLERTRESLGGVRASLLLASLFAASVGAVVAAAFPRVVPVDAMDALATVHEAVWVGLAGMAAAWTGLRLWRAAGRWSPAGSIDRLSKAAGGLVAVGGAALVTAPPVWATVTAVLPPEVATSVTGAASGVGTMTLLLVGVAGATVVALTTWTVLVVLSATPLVPERAGGFALAATLLFAVGLLGGLAGAGYAATFALVAAALFVWDAGEHAATIGASIGRSGTGTQVQLVHLAAGGLVAVGAVLTGLAASAVAPAVGGLASPGAAVLAIALLLSAALLLVGGLHSPDGDGTAVEADVDGGAVGTDADRSDDATGETAGRTRDPDVETAAD